MSSEYPGMRDCPKQAETTLSKFLKHSTNGRDSTAELKSNVLTSLYSLLYTQRSFLA